MAWASRRDAKILLCRENDGARPLQVIAQNLCARKAQQLHVRPRLGADLGEIRPVPNHHQTLIRYGGEGLDDQVHILVGDHA